jgi:hypothetical protein
VPLLLPSHDTRTVTQSSSSANTSSSSSISCHESQQQQKLTNNNIENNNKLVVPKLTLKIPKIAFKHQQQKSFGNIDTNEDSGDEEEDSVDEKDEEEESNISESENEKSTRNDESSSLSENDDKENEEHQAQEVRRPDMPCLKLKIKNLTSNPESVLENFSQITQNDAKETDADLSECPMDIEELQDQQQQQPLQTLIQTEQSEEPKEIHIDGTLVVPANEDIRPHEINLDEALDKIDLRKLMKICLNASYTFCLYCNHARKIVVNGKALAIHFVKHHRFYAMVDSITAEELQPEKIVNKLIASVDELKDSFFNLNTYDDHDREKREGHVTISQDKLYECFQCRFQTSIHKELYLHNRKMHAKSLINCLMCKMSFYNYSELLCHICPGKKIDIYIYKFNAHFSKSKKLNFFTFRCS